ncbi:MAG TPA: class I SAM-dependent methyltransferase [Propionibacteriaceae bacterium]|nr:class I SAM-dependent methyltransferase [Propionibacteriaceae bacterium]
MHFERMADEYAVARPPYPTALYDRLVRLGVVRAGAEVLEVGAGAGLATGDLVALGAHVTALEPGERLAALLAQRVPEASVLVTTLEEADLLENAYDCAVAATSLHWVDLEVGLPVLHRALRPGGHLAVWRTMFGDPEAPRTRFREEVDKVVATRPASPAPVGPREERPTVEELTSGGWFAHLDTCTWRWEVELSTLQVRRLYSTFSNWTTAEVDAVAEAADRCGGRVTERFVSVLHVLRAT